MEKKKDAVWTKTFTSLFGANTIYFFGFYMLMPTLPLYIAQMGYGDILVGAVATAFSIASIVTRMVTGFLISHLGRKNLLRSSMLLSAAVTAVYCLIGTYVGTMVLRVFQGIAFGIVSTLCATIVADILPEKRRGEGIGLFGMGTTIAMALSPSVGLWCEQNYGFDAMFIVSSAAILFSLATIVIFHPEKETEHRFEAKEEKISLLGSLYEPRNNFQHVLLLLFGICRSAENNFLSLMATEYLIAGLSLYYIVQTSVSVVLKIFAGRMYNKYGHKAALIPGSIGGVLWMLCLAMTRTTSMLMLSAVFGGIAIGAIVPAMQTWTVSNVPPNRRSVASASYYNFYDIGLGVGAILLGFIASAVGYSRMYLCASVFMAVFIVLYLHRLSSKSRISR